ncbi:MAG: class I SAM-dependent methyltransferase [Anaerolineae bacterium]|nr:class I SAM-dependent methyltransferase [Anaerolineae bacterium]
MPDPTDALETVRRQRLLLTALDAWLLEQVRPYLGQRILEVGCGHSNLTAPLLRGRELVVATDQDAASVAKVRARFPDAANLVTHTADITDPAVLDLARYRLDTVVCLNVLEHIEDDITALAHMRDLLTEGYLIVIVPALRALYGTIDRAIGHYRRYAKADLRRLIERVGLRVVALHYTNPLGALGWFVNARILRRRVPPAGQLKLFNALVPALAWFERHVRLPFGLSVLSVSTRTA